MPKPIAALVTTIGDLRMSMHLAILKVQQQVQNLNRLNNGIIQANKNGIINLPTTKLFTKGATAHVLPNLQNASLISLGQFANDNFITVLEDHKINIYKKSDPSKGE